MTPERRDALKRLCDTGFAPQVVALREALAEIDRLSAQVEWRDIATAPKDGTWIMVINAEAKEPKPWFVRMKRGTWVNPRNQVITGPLFTHWQPLPDPPSASQTGGGS